VLWQFDCCPADYRMRDGQPIPYSAWNKNSPDGPSEVIATPQVFDGRIYVAIGQSPLHGPGKGALSCIDGATGQCLWQSLQVERTLGDVANADGLVYIADYTSRLHCLDARTGEHLWQHDLQDTLWSASPVVVDGKVITSTENRLLWVFKAGRQKELIAQSRVRTAAITPVVQDDILYFPTQNQLLAIRCKPLQIKTTTP
jgi:outer membrane protein assembly factor BamB